MYVDEDVGEQDEFRKGRGCVYVCNKTNIRKIHNFITIIFIFTNDAILIDESEDQTCKTYG